MQIMNERSSQDAVTHWNEYRKMFTVRSRTQKQKNHCKSMSELIAGNRKRSLKTTEKRQLWVSLNRSCQRAKENKPENIIQIFIALKVFLNV